MSRLIPCLVLLLLGAAPHLPRAKVEFRWLEAKPVKGLTVEKGDVTTCAPDSLAYVHLKPVLTNSAIESTRLSVIDLGGPQHSIHFTLTAAARKKLVDECGKADERMLGVFVDGRRWGVWYFRKREAAEFVPMAGFIPSRTEAERIAAVK